MNHPTDFYLKSILESIELIDEYTFGIGEETFRNNPGVRDMVLRRVEIIAGSANRLPPEIKDNNLHGTWAKLFDLHNTLVNDDTAVDLVTIWQFVQRDLSSLKKAILTARAKA